MIIRWHRPLGRMPSPPPARRRCHRICPVATNFWRDGKESVRRTFGVKAKDCVPRFGRSLGEVDERKMLVLDHPLVGQKLEIDYALPILPAEQHDGNLLHAVSLP